MATKKQSKAASAGSHNKTTKREMKNSRPADNVKILRIWAAVLWGLGVGLEILAGLIFFGRINITAFSAIIQIVLALAIDLTLVAIASRLWKRANCAEAESNECWIWDNLDILATTIAFAPFVLMVLTDVKSDRKVRVAASAAAAAILLIGGLIGADWNSISREELSVAKNNLGDTTVYWAQFGQIYHLDEDCHALNHHDTVYRGTVAQAISAKNGGRKTRLCHFCAKNHGVEGISTDKERVEVPKEEDETSAE